MNDPTERGPAPRTLTASVLFIDVVGSTALRFEVGEERADALARDLEARIGGLVAEHQGRVVKGLGDGVMAVFEAAVDGVSAGVTVQQQVDLAARQDPATAIQVRVGISAGDVSFDGSDVLGTPVVEASRLCALAQPGQVLVADLVRSLSRGRGNFVFEPVGELALRGLPVPVPACQVLWEPAAGHGVPSGQSVPFPTLLASGGGTSYIGRGRVLEALIARLDSVSSGTVPMSAALLSGEPGIGKTRTAAELARRAHAAGAVVLYGSCDEELGVPFQPFVQALDFYSTHHGSPRLGRLAGELTRLCPELPSRVGDLPSPAVSDPRTEEYRLFEAVTSWLIEASQESGIVLVIDDLHWATRATLLLLVHLLKAAAAHDSARLLVVGTYRDTELDRMHPLTSVLADLRRVDGVVRLDLQGLSLGESVALVESVAGHQLGEDALRLAEAAFAETEGNPLFLGEVLRHFVETAAVSLVDGRWQVNDPGQIEVPEGVRDVISRRLGRLSETANRVLSVAAVIGRDFDLEILAQVSDVDENALLDVIDDACRARVVEESGPEHFRFFHAMIKETLYGELSSARRRRLHQLVLQALEKLQPDDVVALAHHAVEAGPAGGDLSAAVTHLLRAAARASESKDLAGAESYYLQAIELIDTGQPDPARRIEASCGLGVVQRDQGIPAFRQTLLGATRAALAAGRLDLAARAAIANFRGTTSSINEVDAERVEALELVLAAHEARRTADAALLGATLVAETHFDYSVPVERRWELTNRSIDIAREHGDPQVIADVINRTSRMFLLPQRAEVGHGLVIEALGFADQVGDPALAAKSRVFAQVSCSVMGDLGRAERFIDEAVEIARADCPPFLEALCRANAVQYLLYRGRIAEAISANNELLGFYQQISLPDGEQWWAATAMGIAFLQGTIADTADPSGAFAERYPNAKAWRGTHAWALAEAGRLDEARAVIDRHGLDHPERFPTDEFITASWAYVAFLALLVDAPDLGAATEHLLRPYEHLWINLQIFTVGPVAWLLAIAVAAQGRYAEAEELFDRSDRLLAERGLDLHRNLHLLYHAVALSRSATADHRLRARELARQGVAATARPELDRLRQRFEQLLASLPVA